jgi:hypothetical protein
MAKHDVDLVLRQVVRAGAGEDRGPFARLLNP